MIHVVIADRGKADIFVTPALGAALNRVQRLENPSAHHTEASLHSDAPGRVLNRASGGHQSYDRGPTAHQHALEHFLHEIASALAHLAKDGAIVLVADRRLLGELRRACAARGMTQIMGEVPKNLVHESADRIAARLARLKGSPITQAI